MTFRSTGERKTFNRTDKTYYSSNNVTAQVTNDLRFKFAYNLSPTYEEGACRTSTAAQPDVALLIDRDAPSASYSGNVDYVINSNWFAGVRGGYFVRDSHESGVPGARGTSSPTRPTSGWPACRRAFSRAPVYRRP